jgi:hypothetical protein
VNRDSGARRLAVQLHNRKHPIPTGVYLLVVVVALVALVFVWQHNMEPSEEAKRQREDSERLHKQLDDLDRKVK